ncbi:deoxyribodipyrimidine photo-lyase [Buchnera aphidicola]|uniref:deoxyribodipyrimidine photo-lyase n=1 Tax=Buchnera aphidicola TaxID=9 RepID=UPI003BEF1B6C
MKKKLVWFRNDLRIHDNTALYHACQYSIDQVFALFMSTPKQWLNHSVSIKKISFIYQNLLYLQNELNNLNIPFYHLQSTDFKQSIYDLNFFCIKHKINYIFYNYQYEINEYNRDVFIKKYFLEQKIIVQGFHDNILIPTKFIYTKNNKPYKKFSSFKKKAIEILCNNIPKCFPTPIKRILLKYHLFNHTEFKKYKINFNINLFPPGEKAAQNRLEDFFNNKIHDYTIKRNFPFLNHTSILSPYLSIGIISLRYCLNILSKRYDNIFNITFLSSWLNEIIWREFYYHLLIGYPLLGKLQSVNSWEKNIIWDNNINYFHAWTQGKTGFPIIDASMRQLKDIGWIHNRLRMITSNFLVKNLLIDWRKGEKYFMSQLIDGDFALNNGGWQWASSIGSDATPYIRIFNPYRQSKKFDKSGHFIRQFIPELKYIPDAHIHNPHTWEDINKITLDYPKPIVDFHENRKKTLLVFKQAKYKFIFK